MTGDGPVVPAYAFDRVILPVPVPVPIPFRDVGSHRRRLMCLHLFRRTQAQLGVGPVFGGDAADALGALVLDLLPEVGVGGEVGAAEGGDGELEDEDSDDYGYAGHPPAELVAERLEEGAAD